MTITDTVVFLMQRSEVISRGQPDETGGSPAHFPRQMKVLKELKRELFLQRERNHTSRIG